MSSLTDRYVWPSLINAIRDIKNGPHVICRLKDSKTLFSYQGKKYRLSALFQKVKDQLRKSKRTGLLTRCVTVNMPGSDNSVAIVFAKGYSELPETETIKGKKQSAQPQWVAIYQPTADCKRPQLSSITPSAEPLKSVLKNGNSSWVLEKIIARISMPRCLPQQSASCVLFSINLLERGRKHGLKRYIVRASGRRSCSDNLCSKTMSVFSRSVCY
jgi:hypothetical protein